MDVKNQTISYMVNFSHVNKWDIKTDGKWYLYEQHFERVQTPAHQLYETLVNGFAVAPDCHPKRHTKHFTEGWYIGLDFDFHEGDNPLNSDIRYLASDPMIKHYAAFLYTTPSHTDDAPRCRAIFILDRPITSAAGYKRATTTLQHMFPHADPSAKDAARLFFGSQDCLSVEIWRRLPVDHLIDYYKLNEERIQAQMEREAEERRQRATIDGRQGSGSGAADGDILAAFEYIIANAADGQKHHTLNKYAYTLGGHVSGGDVDETAALDMLFRAIDKMQNVGSVEHAQNTARQALADGKGKPIR